MAAQGLSVIVGTQSACDALGVTRATYYRHTGRRPVSAPRPAPARKLAPAEVQRAVDLLHGERFVDVAPAEIYATLLDAGDYVCSERTFYRILAGVGEVRERRDQLRHPALVKPQLVATAPNQVWTWDITKLLGPRKGDLFYLYVILDLFSRYGVGWMLAYTESAAHAVRLIEETCQRHGIARGQLTIHADRGAPMTSRMLEAKLFELSVTRSFSRPRVSDDNPFSEAQFKTLKYRPEFPDRFGSFEHALSFCRTTLDWYNHQHRHSGIGYQTPAAVHFGHADAITARRRATLAAAHAAHPERFVHGIPVPPDVPKAVWINQPRADRHLAVGSAV